jgi:hypothetical protein
MAPASLRPVLLSIAALLLGCPTELASDFDGDGTVDVDDCRPEDPAVHPRAVEVCDDLVDNDCDGRTDTADDECIDLDGDGSANDPDCDDEDPDVYPGAPDPYGDGSDSNCDGGDGVDTDEDGYPSNVEGDPDFGSLQDCDDSRALVHPGATDSVGDQLDSNCDGHDGVDLDADGYASELSGGSDCDDEVASIHPDASDPYGDGCGSASATAGHEALATRGSSLAA